MTDLVVGLDVGTSAAKAAAYTVAGVEVARSRVRLPGVEVDGSVHRQPLDAVVAGAEAVLEELTATGAPRSRWRFLALTGQRDTLVMIDDAGNALDAHGRDGEAALISWRDERSALETPGRPTPKTPERIRELRSLISHLAERWTGVSVESEGSWSSRLDLRWMGEGGPGCPPGARPPAVRLPRTVGIGATAGTWGAVPVRVTAGDKNCEMLAAGVAAPGRAGLSFGSAISLGVISGEGIEPSRFPGVVVSRAGVPGRWNVETGLPAGMTSVDTVLRLAEASGLEPPPLRPVAPTDRPTSPAISDLWVLPYFSPPLDSTSPATGSRAGPPTAAVHGLGALHTTRDLLLAWAQGVVCELRRLRPVLEAASGSAIASVVLTGGGSRAFPFARFVADAFRVPVGTIDDPWSGARGAVACGVRAEGGDSAPFEGPRVGNEVDHAEPDHADPDPAASARWDEYMARWTELAAATGETPAV